MELIEEEKIQKYFNEEYNKCNSKKKDYKKIFLRAFDSMWEKEIISILGDDLFFWVEKKLKNFSEEEHVVIFTNEKFEHVFKMPYNPKKNYKEPTFFIRNTHLLLGEKENFIKIEAKHFKKQYVDLMFEELVDLMEKYNEFNRFIKKKK